MPSKNLKGSSFQSCRTNLLIRKNPSDEEKKTVRKFIAARKGEESPLS